MPVSISSQPRVGRVVDDGGVVRGVPKPLRFAASMLAAPDCAIVFYQSGKSSSEGSQVGESVGSIGRHSGAEVETRVKGAENEW